MTSYLNSLTQHYTSLKRLLPHTLSPDADLTITDTQDSHVSRVLRAYYTEKGRPFPSWLGPDPNAPVRVAPAFAAAPNNYGNAQVPPGFRRGPATPGGGLGDLFDSPGQPTPPAKEEPLSLRSRRRLQPTQTSHNQEPQPTARPLPSQRLGSNQSRGMPSPAASENVYTPPPTREQTASERLKARLGGARSASPNTQAQHSNSYDTTPPRPQEGNGGGYFPSGDRGNGGRNGNSGSGGGGGTYSPYENDRSGGRPSPYGNDRGGGRSTPYDSGPNPSSKGNPYAAAPSDPYGGGGGGGGGGGNRGGSRGDPKPYTAASAPWVSGDDGYGYGGGSSGDNYGGGGSGGRSAAGRAPGLPSNPRRR